MPIFGRTGSSTPSSTKVFCPIAGAVQGVAGARIASTVLEQLRALRRDTSGGISARGSTSAAGIIAPAISRSRTAGSKSCGARAQPVEMQAAPSLAVMT